MNQLCAAVVAGNRSLRRGDSRDRLVNCGVSQRVNQDRDRHSVVAHYRFVQLDLLSKSWIAAIAIFTRQLFVVRLAQVSRAARRTAVEVDLYATYSKVIDVGPRVTCKRCGRRLSVVWKCNDVQAKSTRCAHAA